ncbi:MAG: hypothetical protein NC254_00550 [bacterium]|nr:hypothetical protein [bacterium]
MEKEPNPEKEEQPEKNGQSEKSMDRDSRSSGECGYACLNRSAVFVLFSDTFEKIVLTSCDKEVY